MTTVESIKNELKVAISLEVFYKQPSSNDKISYTLVSLINHDGDSLDCGHRVSDVLMPTQEFGGTLMMIISLKLVIKKRGYFKESHKKKRKRKKMISGSTDVLFVVYIRTRHIPKHRSVIFQELTAMSKINPNVFTKYFRVRQELSDETQTSIYFIKDGLQTSIKNNIYCKKGK